MTETNIKKQTELQRGTDRYIQRVRERERERWRARDVEGKRWREG